MRVTRNLHVHRATPFVYLLLRTHRHISHAALTFFALFQERPATTELPEVHAMHARSQKVVSTAVTETALSTPW